MASYYHHTHGTSTDIQDHNSNNFHTLILMNPNLADHHHHQHQHQQPQPSDHSQSHNILLLNSAAATMAAASLSPQPQQPHLPPHPHQFPHEPNNVTLYGYPPQEARDIPRARQGLSLTLSSQNHVLGGGPHSHHQGGGDLAGGNGLVLGSKYLKAAQELLEEVVHVSDDTVNFFKTNNNTTTTTTTNDTDNNNSSKKGNNGNSPSEENDKHGGGGSGNGSGSGGQLSTAERQEVQMKKAKLVTMLDEAEQRYRHYNHQLQIVIESFEQAAGMGSAKTYTALALKTISKQFRCLKDAIQGQIRAANKILGDDHEGGSGSSAGGKIEGSRLKYIDHQIRQQRALQQLGMIQNPNAWRPQRGLPERSVSVLRAWLFEHFLHPYPKDSDKIMLAKQTGLTRSQVSNWFINARVRLWKPMIEEMYMEELKEQEQNNNGLSEEKSAANKENSTNNEDNAAAGTLNHITIQDKITIAENHQLKNCKDQNNAATAVAVAVANASSFMGIPTNSITSFKGNNNNDNNTLTQNQHGFTLTSSLEMEGGISQRSPKRQRSDDVFPYNGSGNTTNAEILIKFGNDQKQERENTNGNGNGYPIISGGMNFIGGGELGAYPIGEIGRFETEDFSATPRFLQGNRISLSLGLPPCENHQHQQQQLDNLSAATNHHTFMSPNPPNIQFRRPNEFGSMNSPSPHSSAAAFECIDIQNRKGFATQLLPDFVA